jgi:hypothetical protein
MFFLNNRKLDLDPKRSRDLRLPAASPVMPPAGSAAVWRNWPNDRLQPPRPRLTDAAGLSLPTVFTLRAGKEVVIRPFRDECGFRATVLLPESAMVFWKLDGLTKIRGTNFGFEIDSQKPPKLENE